MQIASVQALRGWAALGVCLFHFTSFLSDGHLVRTVAEYGKYGVQAFFILSGFVLSYSLYHRSYNWSEYGRFLLRRIIRLEPPYLISIGILVALMWLAATFSPYSQQDGFHLDGVNLLWHVGYLVPYIQGAVWLNPVFWTLAIEFQFYLVLGVFFPLLLHRFRPLRLVFVIIWLSLNFFAFSDIWLPHYSLLFGLGILWFMEIEWIIMPRIAQAGIVITLIAIGFQFDICIAITAAFVYLVGRYWKQVPRVFQRLGDYTYSLYLLHIPIGASLILNFSCKFVKNDALILLLIGFTTLFCIFCAALMSKWVEKPSMRLARRF